MARGRRVEIIEIPVEQLWAAPGDAAGGGRGEMADHPSTWRGSVVTAPRPPPTPGATSPPGGTPHAAGLMGASFRRLIEVPGGRLAVLVELWWRHAEHDDRHLCLGPPRAVGRSWSLPGALRRTRLSRWVPVEILLTPYAERWTLLELMPRRAVHPTRVYFRAGHRSLDRFVASIRAQDRGPSGGTHEPGPGRAHYDPPS